LNVGAPTRTFMLVRSSCQMTAIGFTSAGHRACTIAASSRAQW
jgi:hypothetical protein